MGALHAGHVSLMELGLEHAENLVVSIFVNPTQFDRASDLESYPRDERGDLERCEAAGAELVFIPSVDAMYPDGASISTLVSVHNLTDNLCGRSRPGHFDGVTTVVAKLFNLVEPDVAVFGQKDYQQLAVIRRMVRDLDFPVEIVGAPTARDPDGLAISSRNMLLDAEGRTRGLSLSAGLRAAQAAYVAGERDGRTLERLAADVMSAADVRVDYAECVHPLTLAPLDVVDADGAVLAVAGFVGEIRLIDNAHL